MSETWNAYRMTPSAKPRETAPEDVDDRPALLVVVAGLALFVAGFACCYCYGPRAVFPGTVEMTKARKVQEWVRGYDKTTDYWRLEYIRENGDIERADVWPCFVQHTFDEKQAGSLAIHHGWIYDTYTVYVAE